MKNTHFFNIGDKMVFHARDDGQNLQGGSSGGAAAPPAKPVETSQQNDPWGSVKWDELDDETRKVMEGARDHHRQSVADNIRLTKERDEATLRAQQAARPTPVADPNAPKSNPLDTKITTFLKGKGYSDEQIKTQGAFLTGLFQELIPFIKEDIGKELAPLAGTVVNQQTTNNFTSAQQSQLGQKIFSDDDVSQYVWNIVSQQASRGQAMDSEAILNLGKMAWAQKQLENPQDNQHQQPTNNVNWFPNLQATPPAPVNRSTGGGGSYNFPGAGFRPIAQATGNNNGPTANADTMAALASTFGEMARITSVAPEQFPSDRATHGKGARANSQGRR